MAFLPGNSEGRRNPAALFISAASNSLLADRSRFATGVGSTFTQSKANQALIVKTESTVDSNTELAALSWPRLYIAAKR